MATLSPAITNLPLNLPAGATRIFKFDFLVTTSSPESVNVSLTLTVVGTSTSLVANFMAWMRGSTSQTIQPMVVAINSSTSATVSVFVEVITPAAAVVGTPQNAEFSIKAVQPGSQDAVATVNLSGTVAAPLDNRAGVALVVDQTLGDPSVAQWENVQAAGDTLIGFMRNDDWFNLYSLAPAAQPVMPSSSAFLKPLSQNRIQSINWLTNMATQPAGAIYVNLGLDNPGNTLKQMTYNCVCAPPSRGVLLFSGSAAGFSAAVANQAGIKKFVVWLGDAPASQPGGTYRTVTIADATRAVDQFLLQKFMLQIIGELSGTSTLFDPSGSLQYGQCVEIPFQVTDADCDVRVIVLSDGVEYLQVELEAEGKPVSGGRGSELRRRKTSTFVELNLPRKHLGGGRSLGCGCGSHQEHDDYENDLETPPSGEWRAKLSLKRPNDSDDLTRPVNYSVVVLANSRLKFFAQVDQDSHDIGGSAFITARVEDSGLALTSQFVQIDAEITFPDGGVSKVPLTETSPGRFERQLRLTQPGAALIRVVASGTRVHGIFRPDAARRSRFLRELSFTTHTNQSLRDCRPIRDKNCEPEASSPKPYAGAEHAASPDALASQSDTLEPLRPAIKSFAQRLLGAVAREFLH